MKNNKIKHDCKKCAKESKEFAELSKKFAEKSKDYAELSNYCAVRSKEYAEKCRCEE